MTINPSAFTVRERQIIDHLLKGSSNRQIAEALAIQRVTVTKALGSIYRKLGVKNRVQAAVALSSQYAGNDRPETAGPGSGGW